MEKTDRVLIGLILAVFIMLGLSMCTVTKHTNVDIYIEKGKIK